MATKYGKRKNKHNNIIYTIITAILISAVFLTTVSSFYIDAEEEAYEMLHIQTKQIKDDLTLQIKSDRENLVTMANFASKLYADGESYDLMFEAFKPIGLFSRIGILNPDGTFITKDEIVNLKGKISFAEEARIGEHITGRTQSYSRPGEEVVRAAAPIEVNGKTVGMIYGIIKIETINERYAVRAQDLDAQLFVYNKEDGKFIVDTINEKPGELADLKNRKYNDDYSYEKLVTTDKGYSSFKSIRTGEDLYIHYSTIEDFGWGIMLARYESQVFVKTHAISQNLLVSFAVMISIIVAYLFIVLKRERNRTWVTTQASNIRKLLLEVNQQQGNVFEALKTVVEFSCSRSAFFVDTDGEDYHYILPALREHILLEEERKYIIGELLRYVANYHKINMSTVGMMRIIPDNHLVKTNPELYNFLNEHDIKEVSFAFVTDKNNHVSILGIVNPKKSYVARVLLEEIAVCFSIAIYNKKHLSKTEIAATTDSLTGALNRVSYKKDILVLDEEKPEEFTCIYIDVNELHIMNNKYGHAAGDEMLIYIANTLKDVFFGHRIYRMGGDEFLVFVEGEKQENIKKNIDIFIEQLKPKGYKVAIGMSYRNQSTDCEEMVRWI